MGGGTISRAFDYGISRIAKSRDTYIPLLIAALLYVIYRDDWSSDQMIGFISDATSISASLIAVVLTGIAILISFTDDDFLAFIADSDIYGRLLFIFEYTVLLAIIATALGTFVQAIGPSTLIFYIYIFIFLHLLLSVFRLVPLIITFGEKKSDYRRIQQLGEQDVSISPEHEENENSISNEE